MAQVKKVTIVEPRKMTKLREMVEIIERDGQITPQDIAEEMDVPVTQVYNMVSYQNLRYLDNPKKYPHVYNTGSGYSIAQKREYSVFETGYRMKRSYGVLARGTPAFAHCKMIAPQYFENLRVEYNPSAKKLARLLDSTKK